MNPSRSSTESVWRELNDAQMQARPIIHVRITTDAFAGSPAAMPVSPERARTLGKLWALPDGTVEAAYDGHALELLVHPEDWMSILKQLPHENGFAVQHAMKPGEPERLFGIPVSRR